MPVNIPEQLPAKKFLEQENIFVMTTGRAATQEIRPLEIAILNLMPNKIATETQLLRLIGNTPLQVNITLLSTASYVPKNTAKEHLAAFYLTFEDVLKQNKKFDGLIITGAPVEMMDFESVAYWSELKKLFAWARTNVYSSMYICWAAQAAIYYRYNINKVKLPQKASGIFKHKVLDKNNPLLRGFDDYFYAPHSRYTDCDHAKLKKHEELTVLAQSERAGIYLAARKDLREVFVFGHGEYDHDSLHKEYMRDLKKGINIQPPENYYVDGVVGNIIPISWRAHESLLVSNWLNYCVYQITPYIIEQIN